MTDELVDDAFPVKVESSDVRFHGHVWNIRQDTFEYGDSSITREYVDHTGAVAILAMDDHDRVLLIKQYRHPIGARDWEIPAGLLDIDGESPVIGAQRELAEEVDLVAADWKLLCDFAISPGGSNEVIRVYLARGLTATDSVFDRGEEEADIETRWADLDEAVDAVLTRSVGNSILSIAVLAAQASRARDWTNLGDADSPWPRHPKLRSRD
ncbi:NUDIX hydrolase [Glaciihabitans sp. UYNi722]|uniref:NUDIX hydrolase n=1 Tax=Glaciihabitans sp. UYNi722 TaxID=3156344 RepID=UPI00339495EB